MLPVCSLLCSGAGSPGRGGMHGGLVGSGYHNPSGDLLSMMSKANGGMNLGSVPTGLGPGQQAPGNHSMQPPQQAPQQPQPQQHAALLQQQQQQQSQPPPPQPQVRSLMSSLPPFRLAIHLAKHHHDCPPSASYKAGHMPGSEVVLLRALQCRDAAAPSLCRKILLSRQISGEKWIVADHEVSYNPRVLGLAAYAAPLSLCTC